MTRKDICTSLGLSKKLAEAGVPQEGGIAYWFIDEDGTSLTSDCDKISSYISDSPFYYYRTFVFNELWEMLPLTIDTPREYMKTFIDAGEAPFQFRIVYWNEPNAEPLFAEIGDTPQQAAGKLLLWCIKQGYMNPKEE